MEAIMTNLDSVKIKNMSKKIDNTLILSNINLTLSQGKIYGIVGRNGSGKSMLFKTICGLINPTEGEIYVFGKRISKGQLAEDTGVIIEIPGFLPQYSGLFNLQMLASINNKVTTNKIKETILLVGLDPNDKRPVKKYSLGMKQRLGIAQALMESPRLLILDEPMNSLDSDGVNDVRNILLKLKDKSITILLASHNKDDIETLCDQVYTMENGKLTQTK